MEKPHNRIKALYKSRRVNQYLCNNHYDHDAKFCFIGYAEEIQPHETNN
jgi:hypothetical protein